MSLLHFVMSAALSATSPQALTSQRDPCPIDYPAAMALSQREFDQDINGGWRALAKRPECRETAANLIRLYRELAQSRIKTLLWHEGQLRAEMGQTDAAITLMESARKERFFQEHDQDDWNAYVDATIAFLRGDRPTLLAARDRLARFPVPENYRYIDRTGVLRTGPPPNWPPNLNLVDGLIRCFGKPYREAYGSDECQRTKPR